MKLLKFFLSFAVGVALIIALNQSIGIAPPLGKFLSPFTGFWQNAESGKINFQDNLKLKGPMLSQVFRRVTCDF